jgi:hypothetical protein
MLEQMKTDQLFVRIIAPFGMKKPLCTSFSAATCGRPGRKNEYLSQPAAMTTKRAHTDWTDGVRPKNLRNKGLNKG